MNKNKISQLLEKLDKLESSLPKDETLGLVDSIINEKYKDITSKVKEDSSLAALEAINTKLDKFKKDFQLEPIISAIEEIRANMDQVHESMTMESETASKAHETTKAELTNLIRNTKDDLQGMTGRELAKLLEKITTLEDQLSFQDDTSKNQGQTLKSIVSDFESRIAGLDGLLQGHTSDSMASRTDFGTKVADNTSKIAEVATELDKLRKDTMSRLSNLGGGNMNRNIAVGGNTSVLSRYTDINIKPGSNVSITYSNNHTTKYLDLTIGATGGGGGSSVAGIVRTIETTTVSSVVGGVALTDYVVLANGGVKVTLPTAVGNNNLYTIKNIGVSSVLVAPDGVETIDGDASVIMPVRYTSIDLISNNANWQIT